MSNKNVNTDSAEMWSLFKKCENAHTVMGIPEDTEKAYRFFDGDQWYGLESGGEDMPIYNFIAPLIKYKTAMVAMNDMTVNYSAPTKDEKSQKICVGLSKLAMQKWERLKMDKKCWEAVKNAMIAGDSYVYFYSGEGDCQIIDRTDVFFADESECEISAQPYIFIRERKAVSKVQETAAKNGLADSIVSSIVADGEENDDKCTSLLYMKLKDGDLHFCRLTETAVYEPMQVIPGLGCYPLASLVCNKKRGSCRGAGEVSALIPNQIEINRNLARRLLNAKLTAYSRLVYSNDRIVNPSALSEVGTAIEVEGGGVSSIKDAVNYLTPSSMSPDAKALSDELLSVTRELSGAGDIALGSIDPTQASGTAIIAVRDQAAIPLNEQTALFRQFVEDIAKIWYRQLVLYGGGILLEDGEKISERELELLEPDVRIDISAATPFSKYAREQAVERLFTMGHLSFEEYVSALDDDSSVPKSRLEHIIKNRGGIINGSN